MPTKARPGSCDQKHFWGHNGIMEKKMETTIMDNQMEKKMENEMETGTIGCATRTAKNSEEPQGKASKKNRIQKDRTDAYACLLDCLNMPCSTHWGLARSSREALVPKAKIQSAGNGKNVFFVLLRVFFCSVCVFVFSVFLFCVFLFLSRKRCNSRKTCPGMFFFFVLHSL